MKLWKCEIASGSTRVCYANTSTVYIVAKNYADAEQVLLSEKNTLWVWDFNREITTIELVGSPVILSDNTL